MEGPGGIETEITRNALATITDLMALTVVRTARSPIVRNGLDFSSAIMTATGELVGQGVSQPFHLAGTVPALRSCRNYYRDRVYPGDIFANNDPYEGGSHLPDIYLFKPVFSGDVLVAYLCVMTHHVDIGGRVAGGQSYDSTEIYQEGLRIPPVKLYERGVPNEAVLRIIERAVRAPELVMADLKANMAALRLGEPELLKVVEEWGTENFLERTEQLIDHSEYLTRQALAELPDGTWSFTDYLDNDGITDETIVVKCTITKRGDEIYVDFDGTSPKCKSAIQPVFSTTEGMVYIALKGLLGTHIPDTSGLLRPVTVTAPEDSFANPRPPAAVASRYIGGRIINHAVWGALAQMAPEKAWGCPGGSLANPTFSGWDKSQTPWSSWIFGDSAVGVEPSMGGRYDKDGIEGHSTNVTQLANIPIEIIEHEFPVAIEEYAFIPDSEGAGKFRGGMGLSRQWHLKMDDTLVQVPFDRAKWPPWGVQGGHSSRPPKLIINPGKDQQVITTKTSFVANAGAVLRLEVSGAGGYGDPLDRDPEMVLRNVIEEKISPQRAREVYGVALDASSRKIEWEETQRLRQQLRQTATAR